MIFCTVSSSRDGIRSGRIPICIEYSAIRAARFAARTATNVARASTRVPNAVASEAAVDQSSDTVDNLPNEERRCRLGVEVQ
jgi:hypothetical protein